MLEKFKKLKRSKKIIISIIIAISVIGFWRGIWGFMDLYIFPNNRDLSLLVPLLVGIVVLYLTRHLVKELR